MPIITLLDDRARPKGSRDPLGFELVWSYFGRKVVGNLTTITSSLENFTVALLGFHWANQLAAKVPQDEKQKTVRSNFLRFEQVTGYMRYYGKSKSIMGITRVSKRVKDDSQSFLNIGTDADRQILSDQASYGLWGLYSAATRDTGLAKGSERELTPKGMDIAMQIEAKLNKSKFIEMLTSDKVDKKQIEKLAPSFMAALQDPAIRKTLLQSLLMGSGNNLLQVELWQATQDLIAKKSLPNKKPQYIKELLALNLSTELSENLIAIQEIERVLVAINNVFNYCRYNNGVELEDVINKLESLDGSNYDYAYLPNKLRDPKFPHFILINKILQSLKSKDYREVITHILELNKVVMKQRKGAPWLELESGRTFRVVMKNETAKLLTSKDLISRWDYDYFLGAFLKMSHHFVVLESVELANG